MGTIQNNGSTNQSNELKDLQDIISTVRRQPKFALVAIPVIIIIVISLVSHSGKSDLPDSKDNFNSISSESLESTDTAVTDTAVNEKEKNDIVNDAGDEHNKIDDSHLETENSADAIETDAMDDDKEMDLATRMNKALFKSVVEVTKAKAAKAKAKVVKVAKAAKGKIAKGKRKSDEEIDAEVDEEIDAKIDNEVDEEIDEETNDPTTKFSIIKNGLVPCLKEKDKCNEILEDAYQDSIVTFKRSIVATMMVMNDENVDPDALKKVIMKLISIGDEGKITFSLEVMNVVCNLSRSCRTISKYIKSAAKSKDISKEDVAKMLLIWYNRLFLAAGENIWNKSNLNHPWDYYLELADKYLTSNNIDLNKLMMQ